jgi:hypothetical protein
MHYFKQIWVRFNEPEQFTCILVSLPIQETTYRVYGTNGSHFKFNSEIKIHTNNT